jgi:hypothetical protein
VSVAPGCYKEIVTKIDEYFELLTTEGYRPEKDHKGVPERAGLAD